ncbi:monofunctional biosynthetic peptidoglycan transglycosylase [Hydrocarboniclastica marina]|uniref:Biosynthetic peptidoglycan transglycosylase n=1 Tax=Hydrocarboniclastica marina TaxID=2259620 RepID=A0A4P7XIT5_9ALTE|nr:monofunctional biosynthetic peptidoglycan transglycosylase [Hydrocarboniclastica marina]QCF26665.1 monofunctional biosynthetic peptidoglycan transglycosylase [Hydrocarboniclastica marina]
MPAAAARKRSFASRLWRKLCLLAAFVVLAVLALILLLRFVNPPTSAFMLGHQLSTSSSPLRHQWVEFESMSPWLPLAVMASEDQKFPHHWGFDIGSIGTALRNYSQGGRLRGASTISQQTTKNLFLWSGQSLARKGIEAALTAPLELLWTKRRIMEVYLNIAEFGEGIYGVEAASRHFFGVPASAITAKQAALLAAVLPSPKRFRVDAPSPYIQDRVSWIRRQMAQLGGPGIVRVLD